MTSIRSALSALLTMLAFSTTALAQSNFNVSYVASYGDDTQANCTATQTPCKTLSVAIDKTEVNGTVFCLTPIYSGALVIPRSMQINCAGALIRNDSSSGASIVIDVPVSSSDTLREVVLKGLTTEGGLQNSRSYSFGILIRAASSVIVEGMTINNAAQVGIKDQRTGGQTRLYVKGSTVSNSGGPGVVATSAAPGIMVLDNVSLLNNAYGLATASGNNVTLKNSTVSGNIQAGVEADGGAQVTVENSTITNNNIGVLVGGTIRLLRNNISFNNQAVNGSAVSGGGNFFSGNAAIGNVPSLASGAQADAYN
jgi:hypothetical protein